MDYFTQCVHVIIYLFIFVVFCYLFDVYVECFKFLMQYDIYDADYEDRKAAHQILKQSLFLEEKESIGHTVLHYKEQFSLVCVSLFNLIKCNESLMQQKTEQKCARCHKIALSIILHKVIRPDTATPLIRLMQLNETVDLAESSSFT